MLDPELDEIDMHMTRADLGISMTIATLVLMKTKTEIAVWDELQALLARYRAISSA